MSLSAVLYRKERVIIITKNSYENNVFIVFVYDRRY